MKKVFVNDPFARVRDVFERLYPGKKFFCFLAEGLTDESGEDVCGMTVFPGEGSDESAAPTVYISVDLPIKHAVEILAHELAHVAAGSAEGHGEAWEFAFGYIHQEYLKGQGGEAQ